MRKAGNPGKREPGNENTSPEAMSRWYSSVGNSFNAHNH